MATALGDTKYRINVSDDRFMAPKGMMKEICKACGVEDMPLDHMLCCVYHSLADCYAETIDGLKKISGKKLDALHIIGGGSRDALLNELTAKTTGKRILTGPTEATALGNLLMQMIAAGELADLAAARALIRNSVELGEF